MATALKVIHGKSRRYRCDVSGCRTMTTNLITKRGDIAARPLHICDDCIRAMASLIAQEALKAHEASEGVNTLPEEEIAPETILAHEKGIVAHENDTKHESKPNKAKGGRKVKA